MYVGARKFGCDVSCICVIGRMGKYTIQTPSNLLIVCAYITFYLILDSGTTVTNSDFHVQNLYPFYKTGEANHFMSSFSVLGHCEISQNGAKVKGVFHL
jgi:hypothetical protein